MIRRGFLDSESRKDLTELARDGSAAHRLARRANALVLLDDGMSCEAVAKVLLLDDDAIRTWYRLYEEEGVEGLASFAYEGSACRLNEERQDNLKAWVTETLPWTTREVGAWIEKECGIEYQGRSGLIALLHRLGIAGYGIVAHHVQVAGRAPGAHRVGLGEHPIGLDRVGGQTEDVADAVLLAPVHGLSPSMVAVAADRVAKRTDVPEGVSRIGNAGVRPVPPDAPLSCDLCGATSTP